jgi:hypothetical protein
MTDGKEAVCFPEEGKHMLRVLSGIPGKQGFKIRRYDRWG